MNVDHIPQLIPDLARIVIGYAEVFKRPFEKGRCVECREPTENHRQLCERHKNRCVFCLGSHSNESCRAQYVCCECEDKLLHHREWWLYARRVLGCNTFTAFYNDDDEPIDVEYLVEKSKAAFIDKLNGGMEGSWLEPKDIVRKKS